MVHIALEGNFEDVVKSQEMVNQVMKYVSRRGFTIKSIVSQESTEEVVRVDEPENELQDGLQDGPAENFDKAVQDEEDQKIPRDEEVTDVTPAPAPAKPVSPTDPQV